MGFVSAAPRRERRSKRGVPKAFSISPLSWRFLISGVCVYIYIDSQLCAITSVLDLESCFHVGSGGGASSEVNPIHSRHFSQVLTRGAA